jgi:hypothetical protein
MANETAYSSASKITGLKKFVANAQANVEHYL